MAISLFTGFTANAKIQILIMHSVNRKDARFIHDGRYGPEESGNNSHLKISQANKK